MSAPRQNPRQTSAYDLGVRVLALASLAVLSACVAVGTPTARTAFLVLLLATLADYRAAWHAFSRSIVFYLAVLLAIYAVANAAVMAHALPEFAHEQYASLQIWIILLLFPVVAWWTRGLETRILWCSGIAFAGLVITLLVHFDWAQARAILVGGQRSYFGTWPSDIGLWSGAALLALIAMAGRFLASGQWAWLRRTTWVLAVLFFVEVIILSQSRSTWGALLVLTPLTIVASAVKSDSPTPIRLYAGVAVALTLAIVLIGYANSTAIRKRVDHAVETTQVIATNPLSKTTNQSDGIAPTSFIMRLWIWHFATEKWTERPLIGWGPGFDVTLNLPNAPKVPGTTEGFGHVHDGYLQVLVRFGAIGFLLTMLLAGTMIATAAKAWKQGRASSDIAMALLAVGLLAAIVNLTDVYLMRPGYNVSRLPPDIVFNLLVLGVIYGYTLRGRERLADSSSGRMS